MEGGGGHRPPRRHAPCPPTPPTLWLQKRHGGRCRARRPFPAVRDNPPPPSLYDDEDEDEEEDDEEDDEEEDEEEEEEASP